jgi:hypothetical protein
MVYGYKYPAKDTELRGEVLIDLFNIIDYVTNS